jgi:periplasmic protein TonB
MKNNASLTLIEEWIFKDRNKEYGAYELRLLYENHLRKAYWAATGLFLMLVTIPYMYAWVFSKEGIELMDTCVCCYCPELPPDFPDREKEEVKRILPPLPLPTIKYTAPLIKSDEQVSEEDFPDVEELPGHLISTVSREGRDDGLDFDLLDIDSDLWDEGGEIPSVPVIDAKDTEENVHIWVEQMPQFGSGDKELMEYLAAHIRYPDMARQNGIQGKVIIQFIIDKDGNVTKPKVIRGIGGGCDEEALRVISGMPTWSPGAQNGRKVQVKFTLPVHFSLK